MKNIRLFISTPIAGFENQQEYVNFRNKMIELFSQIEQIDGIDNLYSAISGVSTMDTCDSPAESAIRDLKALRLATHFILFYPYRVISSALIELGYAMAENKKILIIVSQKKDLPYMAQGFEDVQELKTTVIEKDMDKVCVKDIVSFLNSD